MIKKGEQYFTWWRTGLAGPFTYDGGDNYCFNSFIRGDINVMLVVQKGFDYMFERWTFDSKRGEFVEQIPDIVAHDFIDREIAKTEDEDVVWMLTILKANSYKFPGVK